MFRFIHTYTNESFEGLFKNGLFREGDGLKLMHKNYLPDEKSFNNYASKDSKLFSVLKNLKCPFYIDRFQGGIAFPYAYDYNKELLEEYKNLLGENFWGFQMHEWASNHRGEMERVEEALKEFKENNKGLPESVFWKDKIEAIKTDVMALFVEAFSVEEWSELKIPKNTDEFISNLYMLWERRKNTVNSPLIPADSYHMAPKMEIEMGAKLLLPEVGWQIGETRLQIAYYRGMAKAAKIPWGVYYECWGAQDSSFNLTIPHCSDSINNEWSEYDLKEQMEEVTGNKPHLGGSSRSLQDRIWHYAYFSGAEVMGEEYGVCNTFKNFTDFELGEYGLVKKKFLDFTSKYSDLGKTYTPVAIVLPEEMKIFSINDDEDSYLKYPLSGVNNSGSKENVNENLSNKIRALRKVISEIFSSEKEIKEPRYAHDSACLQNSRFPDIFDIIHEDNEEAISNYQYVIDLTYNDDFKNKYSNIITANELKGKLNEILPITFKEELHTVYNKKGENFYVMCLNNRGVINENYKGEYCDSSFDINTEIIFNEDFSVELFEGEGNLTKEKGKFMLNLHAGKWVILKVKKN
ncbi:MAG: hypothetical protein E7564_09480 [Ruminococcaceae bacterium]|nr:hypothetical protein [Oscillospiraceae bacterium]